LLLFALITACNSTPEITDKGTDLNSLEAQANYISSKNACKKIVAMKIYLAEKPFLLGAFDVRDNIAARVPENNFNDLLDALHKNASPLANSSRMAAADSNTENNELPNGLRTHEEQISYLMAYAIAKSFGKKGIPVMPASMALGLADTQTKDALKISANEEKIILSMIKEKMQKTDNDWAENRNRYYSAEEKSFFAANITQKNIISLDSGVQYSFIKQGSGKIPKPKDKVNVNYKGTLLDGTEFDSSYARNKSDIFKLSEMITGFTQALTQVPEGSRVVIYIPANLAYGEKGNDVIPPFAAVVFEVELLGIIN
jgi:FKBP-type peptidyl-prolyl cis-trans isomerase